VRAAGFSVAWAYFLEAEGDKTYTGVFDKRKKFQL
jgi:hypothetical protein